MRAPRGEGGGVAPGVEAAPAALPTVAQRPRQAPERAPRHAQATRIGQAWHEAAHLLGGLAQPGGYFFWAVSGNVGGRPARWPSARPARPKRGPRESQRLTALRSTPQAVTNWSMQRPRWWASTACARRRIRGCGPRKAQASSVSISGASNASGANIPLSKNNILLHHYFWPTT